MKGATFIPVCSDAAGLTFKSQKVFGREDLLAVDRWKRLIEAE
jgi:hypothetical protein